MPPFSRERSMTKRILGLSFHRESICFKLLALLCIELELDLAWQRMNVVISPPFLVASAGHLDTKAL
jgi:hypothetical protein